MRSAKRIRQYKILAWLVVGLLIIAILLTIKGIVSPGNAKDLALNKAINDQNTAYAKGNTFGFTDKERTPQTPKVKYRIAVLGDSFIWGDVLPYQKVWSHKLEAQLLAQYDSIEVIS